VSFWLQVLELGSTVCPTCVDALEAAGEASSAVEMRTAAGIVFASLLIPGTPSGSSSGTYSSSRGIVNQLA
jgi:hypothetical protein